MVLGGLSLAILSARVKLQGGYYWQAWSEHLGPYLRFVVVKSGKPIKVFSIDSGDLVSWYLEEFAPDSRWIKMKTGPNPFLESDDGRQKNEEVESIKNA